MRAVARQLLVSSGYDVLEAGEPDEAIQLAATHPGEIHLLFTDVLLPDRSGPEVADAVTAIRRDVRVLFMSGYADGGLTTDGVLAPGLDFLQKPFTARDLLITVREVLDRDRATGENNAGHLLCRSEADDDLNQ